MSYDPDIPETETDFDRLTGFPAVEAACEAVWISEMRVVQRLMERA